MSSNTHNSKDGKVSEQQRSSSNQKCFFKADTNTSSSFDSPNSLNESIYLKERILTPTQMQQIAKAEPSSKACSKPSSGFATRFNHNENTPESLKGKKFSKIEAIKNSLLRQASGEADDSFVSNEDPSFESDEIENLTLKTYESSNDPALKVSDLKKQFELHNQTSKADTDIFSFSSINSDGPKKISVLYPLQPGAEAAAHNIGPKSFTVGKNSMTKEHQIDQVKLNDSRVFSQESKIKSIIDAFNNKKTYVEPSPQDNDVIVEKLTKNTKNVPETLPSTRQELENSISLNKTNQVDSVPKPSSSAVNLKDNQNEIQSPVLKTADMKIWAPKNPSQNAKVSTPMIHKVVDGKLDLNKKKEMYKSCISGPTDLSFATDRDSNSTNVADISLGNNTETSIVVESDEQIRIRMLKNMIQKTTLDIESGQIDLTSDSHSSIKVKVPLTKPLPASKELLSNFKNFENRPGFLDVKDDIQSSPAHVEIASLSTIAESVADSKILSKIQTSFSPKDLTVEYKYSQKLNLYNGQNLLCSSNDFNSRKPIFRAPGPILDCRPTLAYVQSIITELGIMIYFKIFCDKNTDSWFVLKDPSNTDILGIISDDVALNSFIHSNVVTTVHTRSNFLYFEKKLVIGKFVGTTLCICQNDICIKILKCKNVTKSGKDRILVDGAELSLSCESERDAWVSDLNSVNNTNYL